MDIATLQDLVDRQAINDTLQRYARGIDEFDFELVGAVFTADAVARYSAYPEMIGGAAVAEFLRQHTANTTWHQHMLSVVEVTINEDRATSLTYYVAHAVLRNPDGALSLSVGDYRDGLVRTADGWRIAHRVQRSGYRERP